jgi:aspartate dehydrogenase
LRIGVLGAGAIAGHLLEAIARGEAGAVEVVAVAGRPGGEAGLARLAERHRCATSTEPLDLLHHRPDLVVEAASGAALREHGPALLAGGADLLAMSVGALVDPAFAACLTAAAARVGRRVHVPSGAIGGLDALQAARVAGLDEVILTTSKPPAALAGAPYFSHHSVDLVGLREPTLLYEGPADEAVGHFPANVNVAAAVSLAGIGPRATVVRVVADPGLRRNVHELVARGAFGELRLRLENLPSPTNPRTSLLACLSAVALLRRLGEPLYLG